jgi:hypothetical protein
MKTITYFQFKIQHFPALCEVLTVLNQMTQKIQIKMMMSVLSMPWPLYILQMSLASQDVILIKMHSLGLVTQGQYLNDHDLNYLVPAYEGNLPKILRMLT